MIRTRSERCSPPLIGMKSVTRTTPPSQTNSVSRISVSPR